MKECGKVRSTLQTIRQARGLSAAKVADLVGVTRQTVHAIEAGDYVPNTAVALRLAQALQTSVEDLFSLSDEIEVVEPSEFAVELLPGAEDTAAGEALAIARVGDRFLGVPAQPNPFLLPPADARTASRPVGKVDRNKATAQLLTDRPDWAQRLLVGGCDPAVSLLAAQVRRRSGVTLVPAHLASQTALRSAKDRLIHMGGVHLRDDRTEEYNLPHIRRVFAGTVPLVVTVASWEEGLAVARGNPKKLRGAEDLGRPDLMLINREVGAGCRAVLDAWLKKRSVAPASVPGYSRVAATMLAVAAEVRAGRADYGVTNRVCAQAYGLDFLPLGMARYDLVAPAEFRELAPVQAVLQALQDSAFRRELRALAGYETTSTGMVIG